MKRLTFYIVDVFAEEKFAGNQLAVFRDAKVLSDSEMQQIAKEINYSETTFILSDGKNDAGYCVRIFTPKREVPFAGHPTLGTAYILQREIVKKPLNTIVLNLKIGQIPVTLSYSHGRVNLLWMKQMQPAFGKTFSAKSISQVLKIDRADIDDRFPLQEVSTGLPFVVVPLKTLDAVKRAKMPKDKAILVFCRETYKKENALHVRVFADAYGVPEDPATGSANGCLAGYLVKHRYFRKAWINIRVEQGYEIGRPSLLLLKAEEKEGADIDVHVGGKVVMIAKGVFV